MTRPAEPPPAPERAVPDRAAPEASEMSPYLWGLMAMLVSATVCDAFNFAVIGTVAPIVQTLYGLTNTQWGLVNLIIRLGAPLSFFLIMLADRFGRRPLITLSVLGLALFTGLTGLANSVEEFTIWQFCARVFLVAEYALALIIIGEEYPTRWRSMGISLLGGIGALGTIVAFLAARVVLARADWRAMFLLGLLPALLVLVFRLAKRETRRFELLRQTGALHTSLRTQLAALPVLFQRRYRARSLLVTLIWNCSHMVTSPAVTFWTIHAARNLGYGPERYTVVVAAGYLFGFLVGAPAAGFCMNRFGRRRTCGLYYLGAAVAIFALFRATSTGTLIQTLLMSANIFCFLGAAASTSTLATELFPTDIRATGYSWTTNLFGRVMEIVTPLAIGWLADRIGIPWAVCVMAIGPVIGGLVVLRYAPETSGKTLEEISTELDGRSAAEAR